MNQAIEEVERRERMLRVPELVERHRYHEKGYNKVSERASGWWGKRGDVIGSIAYTCMYGVRWCVGRETRNGMGGVERVSARKMTPRIYVSVATPETAVEG